MGRDSYLGEQGAVQVRRELLLAHSLRHKIATECARVHTSQAL